MFSRRIFYSLRRICWDWNLLLKFINLFIINSIYDPFKFCSKITRREVYLSWSIWSINMEKYHIITWKVKSRVIFLCLSALIEWKSKQLKILNCIQIMIKKVLLRTILICFSCKSNGFWNTKTNRITLKSVINSFE